MDTQGFFFSNIPNFLPDWAGKNKLWGIFLEALSSPWLLSHFFWKKRRCSYVLQDFLFGIGIWFWAVKNLESSHHVSVVRALLYLVLVGNEYDTPWTKEIILAGSRPCTKLVIKIECSMLMNLAADPKYLVKTQRDPSMGRKLLTRVFGVRAAHCCCSHTAVHWEKLDWFDFQH